MKIQIRGLIYNVTVTSKIACRMVHDFLLLKIK
jgi:hypothetical protein